MRGLITTILVCCAIYCLAEQDSQPNRTHHRSGTKQQKTNSRQADNRQTIPVAEVPTGTPAITSTATGDKNQSGEYRDNRPKITDWFMVGLTAAYVFVSVFLWFAIRRQADISERAADAAKSSADALMNIERAWLRVSVVEYVEPGVAVPSICYIKVRNFGKTPAWIVEVGGTFKPIRDVGELPPQPEYGAVDFVQHLPLSEGDDSNGIPINYKTGKVSKAEREAITGGKLKLVVFGFVKYRDPFEREEPYEMRFCYCFQNMSSLFCNLCGPRSYHIHT